MMQVNLGGGLHHMVNYEQVPSQYPQRPVLAAPNFLPTYDSYDLPGKLNMRNRIPQHCALASDLRRRFCAKSDGRFIRDPDPTSC